MPAIMRSYSLPLTHHLSRELGEGAVAIYTQS
jgi:hypothetical protein